MSYPEDTVTAVCKLGQEPGSGMVHMFRLTWVNVVRVLGVTGSLADQSRCKSSLTSGRRDRRQDSRTRVASRGRNSVGLRAKHLNGNMALLEIMQIRLVDMTPSWLP
jgi:hypothetical protein